MLDMVSRSSETGIFLLTRALPCFSKENKAVPNQDVDIVWHESPEQLCEPENPCVCFAAADP